MGIFSKAPKVVPTITVDGIEVVFDPSHKWWAFTYRDQEFITFESHLYMPSRTQLDGILSDVAQLKAEMTERLAKGWKEWDEVKMNDGESYQINLAPFSRNGSFEVSWSGGTSWGDMGIDFTIKEHKIVDESWGD